VCSSDLVSTRLTDANTASKSQTNTELKGVREADRAGRKGLSKPGRELYDRLSTYALEAEVPLGSRKRTAEALRRDLGQVEVERKRVAEEQGRPYRPVTDETKNLSRALELLEKAPDADAVLKRLAARQPGEVERSKRVADIAGDVLRADTAEARRERPAAVRLGIEDEVDASLGATPRSARVALRREQRLARVEEEKAFRRVARSRAAEAALAGEARVLSAQAARKALRGDKAYVKAVREENRAVAARKSAPPKERAAADRRVQKARAERKQIETEARDIAERQLRRDASGVKRSRAEKKRDRAITDREPVARLQRLERKGATTFEAERRYKDAQARRKDADRKTIGDAEAEKQELKRLKKRATTEET